MNERFGQRCNGTEARALLLYRGRVVLVERVVAQNEPRLLPCVARERVHVSNLLEVDLKL